MAVKLRGTAFCSSNLLRLALHAIYSLILHTAATRQALRPQRAEFQDNKVQRHAAGHRYVHMETAYIRRRLL